MARSFSMVDYKTQQTEFFLSKIPESGLDFFSAQCFTDAFVSSARTITFALQAVCTDIPGFSTWYAEHQRVLKADLLARFFHRYRTASIHIGDTVVRGGASSHDSDGQLRVTYFFMEVPDICDPPREDVYTACRSHFAKLLRIVFGAYEAFPAYIDDRWYFTSKNFDSLGKSVEDAELELGFPKGWTNLGDPAMLEERWRILRKTQTSGCQIQELFEKYLGDHFPGPDDKSDA